MKRALVIMAFAEIRSVNGAGLVWKGVTGVVDAGKDYVNTYRDLKKDELEAEQARLRAKIEAAQTAVAAASSGAGAIVGYWGARKAAEEEAEKLRLQQDYLTKVQEAQAEREKEERDAERLAKAHQAALESKDKIEIARIEAEREDNRQKYEERERQFKASAKEAQDKLDQQNKDDQRKVDEKQIRANTIDTAVKVVVPTVGLLGAAGVYAHVANTKERHILAQKNSEHEMEQQRNRNYLIGGLAAAGAVTGLAGAILGKKPKANPKPVAIIPLPKPVYNNGWFSKKTNKIPGQIPNEAPKSSNKTLILIPLIAVLVAAAIAAFCLIHNGGKKPESKKTEQKTILYEQPAPLALRAPESEPEDESEEEEENDEESESEDEKSAGEGDEDDEYVSDKLLQSLRDLGNVMKTERIL